MLNIRISATAAGASSTSVRYDVPATTKMPLKTASRAAIPIIMAKNISPR